MKISLSISGVPQTIEAANALAERLRNPMPALLRAGIYVANQAVVRIDRGGDPPWQPRTREYPWHILIKTGNLRNSLAGGAAVTSDGPFRVQIGTNVKSSSGFSYAKALQEGTKNGLPARPFLYVDQADDTRIKQILAGYFNTGETQGDVA